MNRRDLLHFLALLGAGGIAPSVYARPISAARDNRVLVLVELNGGNDSLNTFIPLEHDARYQLLRPGLALKKSERIGLDERMDLHSALAPLLFSWQESDLALVHGLGYEKPSLSHFRSIEIWDTASDSDSYANNGWLSGLANVRANAGIGAVVLGRNSGPVVGGSGTVLQADFLRGFLEKGQQLTHINDANKNAAYAHLLSVQNTLAAVAKDLVPMLKRANVVKTAFPATQLGKQLAEVAQLIDLGGNIPVFKVALSGFDTHRNQKPTHHRLLSQLSAGLAAFREEMIRAGKWDQVVVMTYSEFGRRPKMNGSGGTDHGTAATHIVMGGKVRGGHIGEHPILPVKDNTNMQFTTDFKALYQTVLDQWFQHPEIRLADGLDGNLPLLRDVR